MYSKCVVGSKRLGSELCPGMPEDKVVRMRPPSPPPMTPPLALSSGLGNRMLVRKVTPFSEKKSSRQYEIKSAIRDQVFNLCQDESMSDEEILDLLDYAKREYIRLMKMVDQEPQLALEAALKGRTLSERNQLTRLLTHTAEGELNEKMLQIFPTLRCRSVGLHTASNRKEREDKINTQFIVDFMHDICR